MCLLVGLLVSLFFVYFDCRWVEFCAEVKTASRMIEEIVAQSEEQMSLGPVGLDYRKHLCKY